MTFAIKAENLGKRYRIGHQTSTANTLRDSLMGSLMQIARKIRHPSHAIHHGQTEEFWALRDIHFEIKQGDRVGIIGRNGAGKSTLLKILSRITEPTTGSFITRGRVASLLEVGTGFHPELSGRENIFLNGALLGMSKADILKQFDAIIDFSGIEKFLDTPVKRYSSGMYVRLAFAVAAHLDPDILIVDEVLAVGDAEFQKKCLGKMEDAGRDGRTVVFVSHNMGAVKNLCDKGLLLTEGYSIGLTPIATALASYQQMGVLLSVVDLDHHPHRNPKYERVLQRLEFTKTTQVAIHEALSIQIAFNSQTIPESFNIAIYVQDHNGVRVTSFLSPRLQNKSNKISLLIPDFPLFPGLYSLSIRIWNPGILYDEIENAATIEVIEASYSLYPANHLKSSFGYVHCISHWENSQL